ncbi:MAG TPA: DUF2516 family protein [Dermatophilaceae bacterium]|nr:DUF2516 family protein [Dermatophilaceae bacterium]
MPSLDMVQGYVALALGVAALGMEAFALVDAARHRPDAFVAAGKRTKGFWLAVTGVAAAVGLLSVASPLNLFSLLGVVGAGVYLADVRPALRAVSGGGRHQGPYGPW